MVARELSRAGIAPALWTIPSLGVPLREAVDWLATLDPAAYGDDGSILVEFRREGPGDAIVNCPSTFGMYPFLSAVAGARLISVPRRSDRSVDMAAIEAVSGKLAQAM